MEDIGLVSVSYELEILYMLAMRARRTDILCCYFLALNSTHLVIIDMPLCSSTYWPDYSHSHWSRALTKGSDVSKGQLTIDGGSN